MKHNRRKAWLKAYFMTNKHKHFTKVEVDRFIEVHTFLRECKGKREHPKNKDE